MHLHYRTVAGRVLRDETTLARIRRSRSRRLGKTCGSAATRAATSRPPGATRVAASSTAITPPGRRNAARPSTSGCSRSAARYRASARACERRSPTPGQALFQYVDERGRPRRIDSTDINAWLADAAAGPVTAKDFRTWHGSVLALQLALEPEASMTSVLAGVSRALGNTPAVCRKAYVHPAVLDTIGAAGAATQAASAADTAEPTSRGLRAAEQRLLRLLRSLTRPRAKTAPC